MQYKDFTIVMYTSNNIQRNDASYNGFLCEVYSKYDNVCSAPLDCFNIALGRDLDSDEYNDVLLFVKSYIDKNYHELKELENSYFCNDTLS